MKKWIKRFVITLGLLLLVAGLAVSYLLYLLTSRVEGEYFDSNGVPIHYTVDGDGEEAVILVHGLAAQADVNWRLAGVTDLLSDKYKVVMFDLRGHGLSGKPDDPELYGIEMVRDIPRLMDHLGIERAHVAGYSLGGFITLKFATQYPQRVLSASYCASGWKDPEDPADIRSPYRSPDTPDTFKDSKEKQDTPKKNIHPPVQAASVLDFDFLETPVDYVKDYVGESFMPKTVRKALKASYEDFIVSKEAIEENTVPSICFIGTRDGLKPYADAMKEHMPNLELVVLDGADHITTAINSEFHEKLRAFIEAHGN